MSASSPLRTEMKITMLVKMDGIGYTEAFIGLVFGSATFWGAIFAFAYSRRQFGGSARRYLFAYSAISIATVALFVLLTAWEKRAG